MQEIQLKKNRPTVEITATNLRSLSNQWPCLEPNKWVSAINIALTGFSAASPRKVESSFRGFRVGHLH